MAMWTAVLFGRTRVIEHDPVEEPEAYNIALTRAVAGDLVDFKPYDQEHIWTPLERTQFLVVTIDGPTLEQMTALKECIWDLNSYPVYNPLDNGSWRSQLVAYWNTLPQEKKDQLIAWWNSLSEAEKDALYDKYIVEFRDSCRFPTKIARTCRFNIPEADLAGKGVDINQMNDKNLLYDPKPAFIHLEVKDMMKDRYVLGSDTLQLIQPQTDQELEDRRV